MTVAILLAAGALVLLAAAWLRREGLVLVGLVAFGASYAVWLSGTHGPRASVAAPLVAAGMLVAGEVVSLAATRTPGWRSELSRTLVWLLGIGLAAMLVATVILVIASIGVGRSYRLTIAGTATAVLAVVLLRALVARALAR